jgi:nucleoside 2-deoxyribosyltransferase
MLQEHGEVLTEHLGSNEIIERKDRVLSDKQIHDRDMKWVREADVLVAEVSVASLGVGYEIGRAIEWGKPVLCLFHKDSELTLSAMIAGSEGVENHSYRSLEEMSEILSGFLKGHAPDRIS